MISGEDCVVFSTLVCVLWSELLMTSAIICPLWSSVYECRKVECAFTSPVRTECVMFVMCCMQCCMSVSAVFSAWMCCLEEVGTVVKLCALGVLASGVSLVSRIVMIYACVT